MRLNRSHTVGTSLSAVALACVVGCCSATRIAPRLPDRSLLSEIRRNEVVIEAMEAEILVLERHVQSLERAATTEASGDWRRKLEATRESAYPARQRLRDTTEVRAIGQRRLELLRAEIPFLREQVLHDTK